MEICGPVMLYTIRSGLLPTGIIIILPGPTGQMIIIFGGIIPGATMAGEDSIRSTARDTTIRTGITGIRITHTGQGITHRHPISAVRSLIAMH